MNTECKQKTKPIQLIAFDLDGTFLNDEKQIPEINLRAIQAAAEKGIYIVPATGRLWNGLPPLLREAAFIRYYILINGAQIYDAKENRVLAAAELSNEQTLALFEHGEELGCLYDCYMQDQAYMTQKYYDQLEEFVPEKNYVGYMKSIRRPVADLREMVHGYGGSIQKVQYFFQDMEQRAFEMAHLSERVPGVKATASLKSNIEINSADANKGAALKKLCEHLGISSECALAFGDGTNDLSMIEAAGVGTAMANADPSLLCAANKIAASNNEGGVGKMISSLLELELNQA